MYSVFFIILIFTHILGDFYFQTEKMAKKKEESIAWVFLHSCVYMVTVAGVLLFNFSLSLKIIICIIFFSVIHAIIDIIKFLYMRTMKKKRKWTLEKERDVFLIDQVLHFICILVFSYVFRIRSTSFQISFYILNDFFQTFQIPMMRVLTWAVALLLIHKPANILTTKLISVYKPCKTELEIKKDNNAGKFIGTIERMIILIFISIGQYSAIGLVMTAKSIARYDRISKEKDFAEYYLIGTLISVMIVIVVSFLLKVESIM